MQTDLLSKLVLNVLSEKGFDKLPQAEQDKMLPRFVATLEKQIGVELLPFLSEAGAEEFGKLLEKGVTGEEWYNFWNKYVPDFEEKVKEIIINFAEKLNK